MAVEINEIIACEYHRNGIAGAGFYVCDFLFSDEYQTDVEARAVVFPDDEEKTPRNYAITTMDPRERWRGDHFIDALWPKIKEDSEMKWQLLLAKANKEKTHAT